MTHAVTVTVNGVAYRRDVEPRTSLAEFLREDLDLTGTHVGCEHGVCGACTVLLDGEPMRACLIFAVQADGCGVTTVEGLAGPEGDRGPDGRAGVAPGAAGAPADAWWERGEPPLHPIQQAFMDKHALQCGFCTPGILVATRAFLDENPSPSHEEIREMLAGHLCRCTGYHFVVDAIAEAARRLRARDGG